MLKAVTRAPAFAVTVALTLALGIGLSTAVFTVANALLLRPLAVRDQDRLVLLWGETRDGKFPNFPLALTDVRDFQRRSHAVSDVAFFPFRGAASIPVRANEREFPVQTSLVSGNFFDVLGSRPVIGRALRAEDDVVGAAPVLVLSHRAWRQRFGGDSGVVGRSMTMLQTGRSYTIVGVMPQGLEYPHGTDVWAPLIAYSAAAGFLDIVDKELDILARLRPGASPAQAQAELTNFFARPGAPQWHRNLRGVAHTFPDVVLGNTKPAVLIVMLAAGLLLFITCVNVANLFLVRALGRVKELVVRAALGASRARIIGQLLTESAALAVAGGLLGCALAVAGVKAFVALTPASVPRIDEVTLNGDALLAAVLITTGAMLLSGLGPALFTSRVNASDAFKSGSRATASRGMRRVAEVLVVAQIALAAVSLTAAVLVGRSLDKLQRVELAFDPGRLLVANLATRQDQVTDPQRQRAALDLVVTTAAALPGVRAVSPVFTVPFSGSGGGVDGRLSKPGQSREDAANNPVLNMEIAAPNYFSMLGIPVLRGRAFVEGDREGTAPVVIVSSAVARHFWPGGDPIGEHLGGMGPRQLTVVGVVPETRYRELQTARPTVYFPLSQSPFSPSALLIRTADSPADIVPALRRAIAAAHGAVAVVSATPLETLLDAPRAEPRLNAIVLALFAAAAVSLAAIGLFAITATMVRQRVHELGIRMALGATARDVRRMVMGRGLSLAAIGAVVGMVSALATSRLLSALLFEVSPTDAVTYVLVAAVILAIAAIASLVPAQHSARIDPVIALRTDA